MVWFYKRSDHEGLNEYLEEALQEATDGEDLSPNYSWRKLSSAILDAAERFIPSRLISTSKSLPWLVLRCMKSRDDAHKKS